MTMTYNGEDIETTANGYLVNPEDWNEGLAQELANADGITLTSEHLDVISYLREEFFNNNGTQPNTRTIVKAMSEQWGREVDQKSLYDLFNGDPSKLAGRIAGLPESKRKGGY
ncbi:MAG: TusE/DsrC/DsvC family sulfur relay protein [Hyphomicrobiaceae bacterium]|nr:TusE/DsrC/DsvC family sulfur relay protein [Hyphomicrobiaceae bacterium]